MTVFFTLHNTLMLIDISFLFSSKPHLPNNVLSMTQLKTMDLPDQVKALLINGKIVASVLNPFILSAGCIKY